MKIVKLLLLASLVVLQSACAVYMAAKQPDKKDLSLFRVGTNRAMLLAEFGLPVVSEERDGHKYEIYKFIDGYGAGAKAGRAIFHGAADVFTLGLWEVVGTPTEGVFSGDEVAYRVRYDKNDLVDEVAALKK